MTQPRRVIIAAGGTGGHLFPALAVADELTQTFPSIELLFVGSSGGLEAKLLRDRSLVLLPSGKLRGAALGVRARTLATLPRAAMQALGVVRRFAPDVVLGFGGYASAPVAAAAALLRIPVLLLEQNAIPGTVNRVLAHIANAVVVAFEGAARWLPAGKAVLLGNPVRGSVLIAARQPRQHAGPTLLVLGGSQGAHAINELMLEGAAELAARVPGVRLIHQTGVADHQRVAAHYQELGLMAEVAPFFEDIGALYREADLVVGRSGATTLAELAALGVPALLIPYPHAADDHQTHNALDICRRGGGILLRQVATSGRLLAEVAGDLLSDPHRLALMRAAMQSCGRVTAGSDVVALVHKTHLARRARRKKGSKTCEV